MAFTINTRNRWYGAAMIFIGILAIIAPLSAGRWAVSILGLLLLAAGVAEIIRAFRTGIQSPAGVTYIGGTSMLAVGLLLLWNPRLAIGGLFLS